jgi:activating signal cointegrator 1
MKVYCITLSQPFATLVVRGFKLIETRGRNTNYRGELHIHAGKSKTYNGISCRELCYQDPFNKYITPEQYDSLPFGAIIGKVNLVDTGKSESFVSISQNKIKYGWPAQINWPEELEFGDYSHGRYGYLLKDNIEFPIAIPAKGNQIIPWEFDMPDKIGCNLLNGGHASFDGMPDKKTVEALESMVEAAKKMKL